MFLTGEGNHFFYGVSEKCHGVGVIKILITLAVIALSVVSGDVMAWSSDVTGGYVNFGGLLPREEKLKNPREVKVGDAAGGLDAFVKNFGDKGEVYFFIEKSVPVLQIRVSGGENPGGHWFEGKKGITPHIDYHGAIDVGKSDNGRVYLYINVKDKSGGRSAGRICRSFSGCWCIRAFPL